LRYHGESWWWNVDFAHWIRFDETKTVGIVDDAFAFFLLFIIIFFIANALKCWWCMRVGKWNDRFIDFFIFIDLQLHWIHAFAISRYHFLIQTIKGKLITTS
jgi:hypothetical protein